MNRSEEKFKSIRDLSFWAFFGPDDLGTLEPVAEGGTGMVYKAINKTEGVVCVKDCRYEEDFNRETFLLEHCDHPNIVMIFGLLAPGVKGCLGLPIEFGYVMEYVSGGTLDKMIHSAEKYSLFTSLSLICQAARGLKEVHSNGIIHRDIKPLNILVDIVRKTAKLADMGISKTLMETLTGERFTAVYSPPEIFSKERVEYDKSYDIYSLAISLWEVLHRRRAFAEIYGNNRIISEFVKSGGRPTIDDALTPTRVKELLENCWSQNPADRWPIDQIISVLEGEMQANRLPHIITPTIDEKLYSKVMRIKYSPVEDVYYRGEEAICDWESLTKSSLNVRRRIEENHKMVYLTRAPGTDTGAIVWMIDLTGIQAKSIKINFFNAKIFDENAEMAISVSGGEVNRFIEPVDIALEETSIEIEDPPPALFTISNWLIENPTILLTSNFINTFATMGPTGGPLTEFDKKCIASPDNLAKNAIVANVLRLNVGY